jgi:hypothetical protein
VVSFEPLASTYPISVEFTADVGSRGYSMGYFNKYQLKKVG